MKQRGDDFPPKFYLILHPPPQGKQKPEEPAASRGPAPRGVEEFPEANQVTQVLAGNPSIRITVLGNNTDPWAQIQMH